MCFFFLSLLFFFQINLKKFLAVCSELGLSGWQLFDPNDLGVGGDVMWVFTVLNRILGFLTTSPKIMQTKQLLILLSFYFHDEVLQRLKTFIYMNSWFRRVLCFAIEDAWISRLFHDVAFSWQLGKLLCGSKCHWFSEILPSKQSLS